MAEPVFGYQEIAATYMAHAHRFGLHDEMGVGKTATTIRAIDMIGARRGIVVAPALARENWVREFKRFGMTPFRLCKGETIHDFTAWRKGRFNVIVTSYELATKWASEIFMTGEPLDFFAMDEAHYLKNAASKRSKALLGPESDGKDSPLAWVKHAWHITGTPMANDPLDIYTFLKFTGDTDLHREVFIRRYFYQMPGAYSVRTEPKPEMLDELKALIRRHSIRRTQKEVGLELPPIFLTTYVVDGDTKAVTAALKEHPDLERAIVAALDAGGLSFLDAQYIATLRRLIGEAKAVPYAHELADEILAYGKKRVVFGIHLDALANVAHILRKRGIKCVVVNGETPKANADQHVVDFQNDPSVMVFLGNIRKAGTAITLTAACDIDILESDWSPAGNAQAIKRVHRIGQFSVVRARFITLAKSIDEVVNDVVSRKTAAIASIDGSAMAAAPLLTL